MPFEKRQTFFLEKLVSPLNEGLSQLKAAKLLQYEDDGGAEAVKGEAEDEEEEESGQSLEAAAAETSNEQDGRVPGQHDDDEQGRMERFHLAARPFF